MTAAHPKTLAEWKAYADTLTGQALWDAAVSANTMAFVQVLQEEGYEAEQIHAVIHLLAKRFVTLGERAPADGFYDLAAMGFSAAPVKI